MTGPPDVGPEVRTDLAWQRTGLGLLSVGALLAARALHDDVPALLVAAGLAALLGLGVLGALAPLRDRALRRRRVAGEDVGAPWAAAAVTIAVVAVAVAAVVGVLTPR